MTGPLRYFAQPFWRGRQEAAQIYEFCCAVDAEEGASLLVKGGADGAVAWIQAASEEEGGASREPEDLIKVGDVTPVLIDPDGRDPWLDDTAYFKIDCTVQGDTWTQIDPLAGEYLDEEAA